MPDSVGTSTWQKVLLPVRSWGFGHRWGALQHHLAGTVRGKGLFAQAKYLNWEV